MPRDSRTITPDHAACFETKTPQHAARLFNHAFHACQTVTSDTAILSLPILNQSHNIIQPDTLLPVVLIITEINRRAASKWLLELGTCLLDVQVSTDLGEYHTAQPSCDDAACGGFDKTAKPCLSARLSDPMLGLYR